MDADTPSAARFGALASSDVDDNVDDDADDPPSVNDEMRALLESHNLSEHADAIAELGLRTIEDLLSMDDELEDDMRDLLGESRRSRRSLFAWLKEERVNLALRPPAGSQSAHFYDLRASLNMTDVSGLEAATILRVDIDPFSGEDGRHQRTTVRMPPGALDMQVQAAKVEAVPIVSLIGPTGTGKSFLTSSFIERESPTGRWPVVAQPGQHVPTSAHLCLHRGVFQPGCDHAKPLLLLDFEGEDGRIPRTLIEQGMQKLSSLRNLGMNSCGLRAQMDETIKTRQHVIKDVLPPLAYLISDVVVFIDSVEPRRTERIARIRDFASQAHTAIASVDYRPALFIVQNKWTRGEREAAVFDITDEYDWIQNDLKALFSSVTVLRIPAATDTHHFEDSLYTLHNLLETATDQVHQQRKDAGCLYSERELWFSFSSLVEQLDQRGVGSQRKSLSHYVNGKRASLTPADNALRALSKFGPLSGDNVLDGETFTQRVDQVLEWYAYALAGEARSQHAEGQRLTRDGLRALFDKIIKVCSAEEPCTSVYQHNGREYRCTQRRCGHSHAHRHPAMLTRASENLIMRLLSFGFWMDTVPCVWNAPNGFEQFATRPSFDAFERHFDTFMAMQQAAYQKSFRLSLEWDETAQRQARLVASSAEAAEEDTCLLCLRVSADMFVLENASCRHSLCRQCILTRKALSTEPDVVVCPFCQHSSTLRSTPSDDSGFRILSLDGGGVRGLIEVLVLKELEKVFHPLPVTSLFDLIMGTSAGGIIAMALHAKVPLQEVDDFLAIEAARILDVPGFVATFRRAMNGAACESSKFKEALEKLLGKAPRLGPKDGPPYVMCTAYEDAKQATVVFGSFPQTFSPGNRTQFIHGPAIHAAPLAAYATAAAPTYFGPLTINVTYNNNPNMYQRTFVDGGIQANCPATLAVKFATEFQLDSRADNFVEMIASLGTGLESPSLAVPHANGLSWAARLVSFVLESEKMWLDGIVENAALRDVPKVRVNPPGLGSLDPFVSSSIPELRDGMTEYFDSPAGKHTMGRLTHLVHAKLWHIKRQANLVAGITTQMTIEMKDHRLNFSDMEEAVLRKIIEDRCDGEPSVTPHSGQLYEEAEEAFGKQPFVPPLKGHFVIKFNGAEVVLPGREFDISSAEPGTPQLQVWWRSDFGDFPISGFPRSIRVVGEEQGSCPAPGPASGPSPSPAAGLHSAEHATGTGPVTGLGDMEEVPPSAEASSSSFR